MEPAGSGGEGREPALVFNRERRLHARAYDYWVSLLRGRAMPQLTDLDADHLQSHAGHSVLIELSDGGAPAIAFLGQELRDEAGIGPARPTIDQVPEHTLLAELLRRLPDIVARRAPVGFEAEFAGRAGTANRHRGILLPLAGEDGSLAAVYGVMSWKAMVAAERLPDIAAAVASAIHARNATPPTSIWGDGPGATARQEAPAAPSLDQRIAAARTWAALASTNRSHNRTSLHAALGGAFDVLLDARADAVGFAALADAAHVGTAVTARNVVDLVFGGPLGALSRLERRRYALVLDHGVRLGMGPGRLAPWLDGLSGGHRAAAQAERRAVRQEQRRAGIAETWDWVEAQPTLGHIALSTMDDDLLLLLGRRATGGVEVIATVGHAPHLTDAALARARAA